MKITRKQVLVTSFLLLATAAIAQTVYTYKCAKCGYIVQYGNPPGNPPKCPNDGWSMMQQR